MIRIRTRIRITSIITIKTNMVRAYRTYQVDKVCKMSVDYSILLFYTDLIEERGKYCLLNIYNRVYRECKRRNLEEGKMMVKDITENYSI